MSLGRRIKEIVVGLLKIVLGIILIAVPDDGHFIVSVILGISLLIYGIRNLIYYITMARFMVGGRLILYLGVLLVDGAGLLMAFSDVPTVYIMIYLIVIYAVSGMIDLMHALEEKSMQVSTWRFQMSIAIINLLIVVACFAFIWSGRICVYIYAGGLIYSALMNIIAAIRAPRPSVIL